jgi:hypothetical protein
VKITVRCGVFDGGSQCGRELGAFAWDTWPGPLWIHGGTDYDGGLSDELHFDCTKQGTTRTYNDDVRPAIEAGRRVIMATSVTRG